MPGVPINGTDFNNAYWSNGNATATGSTLGSYWNEVSGATQKMQFEREEAEKARLFNSAEAEKSRDWQTEMSNTAYQRAAADMAAAGINPASLGGNASMSPATAGTATSASGPAASAPGGVSNGGLIGVVMQGIGMALKAKIARSSLAVDKDGLDLGRFKAESQKALNAAKIADLEVNTALKERTKRILNSQDLQKYAEKVKERARAKKAMKEITDAELDRMIDQVEHRSS